ncbi:MAG: hypothetical protein AMXMBFR84_41900 [Candidatus Hydrogenedentota bacterium]
MRLISLLGMGLAIVQPCGFAFTVPDFATQVRPIFEKHCYRCHGPEAQKSGYRLDNRNIALKGGDSGKAAITPHDAANSPLIRFVTGQDPDVLMPPSRAGTPTLTAEEVAILRAWIDAGPAWPDEFAGELPVQEIHWSLLALAKPEVPIECTNPIDAFVQAKLAKHGITPSPRADRRTLLKRLYYDLVGLPPTPEEMDAFCANQDPLVYESKVDELLSSPRLGERWARHWLDTIHFADSHGYEHDIARENAWRYRDYVIQAINNDTPWPRFVKEQIAADIFYPNEPWLTPALGYLGAGTFDLSTYSTAPVTFDYLDRDDLVTQTAAAFFSTTANCARCHTHKFDPIPQEDYYALQAVFSGILKGDLAYDENAQVAQDRRHWQKVQAAAKTMDTGTLLTHENDTLVQEWLSRRGTGATWSPLAIETFLSAEGATQIRDAEGTIRVNGKLPEKDTYTVTGTTKLTEVTALRLQVLAEGSLPAGGPGRAENGNFHLSEIEMNVFEPGTAEPRKIAFKRATADFSQAEWEVDKALDGRSGSAWGIHPAEGKPHYAVFELAEPLAIESESRLVITLKQLHGGSHLIGAFALSLTSDSPEKTVATPADAEAAMAIPEHDRKELHHAAIAAFALRFIAEDALASLPEQSRVFAAAKAVDILAGDPPRDPKSLPEPKTVHLLQRGDFDKPGDAVPPGALSALQHLPARFVLNDPRNEGERRAALAEWIVHPDNVLSWRSIVNRVWHYHFGRGLCETPSDFGEMGDAPSHPELIDWLAVWFRDEAKGSLKALHRLIVTSETYKQSSEYRDDGAEKDSGNRYLWRQNRHRLDADAFRDFTLAVAGTLDLSMGGPAVQHFSQSKGPQLTPALDYKDFDWNGPGAGRRSIYRFVWRGIPDPLLEALDFPDLGLLSPVRGFSASSLQALTMYNNEFVLHHSRALAERLRKEAPDTKSQIQRAARLVWLRDADPAEVEAYAAFAEKYGLESFCRVMLNSNEYLFVD